MPMPNNKQINSTDKGSNNYAVTLFAIFDKRLVWFIQEKLLSQITCSRFMKIRDALKVFSPSESKGKISIILSAQLDDLSQANHKNFEYPVSNKFVIGSYAKLNDFCLYLIESLETIFFSDDTNVQWTLFSFLSQAFETKSHLYLGGQVTTEIGRNKRNNIVLLMFNVHSFFSFRFLISDLYHEVGHYLPFSEGLKDLYVEYNIRLFAKIISYFLTKELITDYVLVKVKEDSFNDVYIELRKNIEERIFNRLLANKVTILDFDHYRHKDEFESAKLFGQFVFFLTKQSNLFYRCDEDENIRGVICDIIRESEEVENSSENDAFYYQCLQIIDNYTHYSSECDFTDTIMSHLPEGDTNFNQTALRKKLTGYWQEAVKRKSDNDKKFFSDVCGNTFDSVKKMVNAFCCQDTETPVSIPNNYLKIVNVFASNGLLEKSEINEKHVTDIILSLLQSETVLNKLFRDFNYYQNITEEVISDKFMTCLLDIKSEGYVDIFESFFKESSSGTKPNHEEYCMRRRILYDGMENENGNGQCYSAGIINEYIEITKQFLANLQSYIEEKKKGHISQYGSNIPEWKDSAYGNGEVNEINFIHDVLSYYSSSAPGRKGAA